LFYYFWRIFAVVFNHGLVDGGKKLGEETEINLKQFSRKVEIKGFNRERIEKGGVDQETVAAFLGDLFE
jgi:hypothetical protein